MRLENSGTMLLSAEGRLVTGVLERGSLMLGLKRLKGSMRMLALVAAFAIAAGAGPETRSLDYRILATQKTSTMEKELNEAAAAGYRFSKVMGGQTANGGKEVVVAMIKDAGEVALAARQYRLLATNKTSTMQKELQQAADKGYEYKDQTVFESQYGGKEVAVIMEHNPSSKTLPRSYRLLATSRTSTMQKELRELGEQGYALLGLTVGKTAMGGDQIVAILGKD